MRSFQILLVAAVLAGCPSPSTPNCATKCASVEVPAAICVDGKTIRAFALELNECSQSCSFVPLERTCAGACVAGTCVDDLNPADAGTNTDGGSTTDAGSTDAGVSTDGGLSSDAGTDGGTNVCDNVTCATPPSSVCLDATRLRVFDARGVCGSGQCIYGSREETCTAGCVNGACQNNPCQGVTCSTPPATVCTDANTLKSFSPNGTCSNGGCRYSEMLTTCQFGCANGQCTNDPCAGVSCVQPPAPFCSNATTLRTFSAQGVCASGSCLYTPSDTTCRFGCSNGRCTNDPCQGVTCSTPPASACLDANTLRTFTAAGVCSGGSCLYSPLDSTCQFGCANGACTGNPCQGVACSTPPAPTCVGTNTLRTHSSSGTCTNGACSYTASDTACSFGCTNGACVGNPCQGVSCNTPPAATCVDTTTLRTFNTAGTCTGGACSYSATDSTCQFGCANGACTGNPCQGVTCNRPPAATCVTPTTLRSFATAGTCSGGACSYVASESTCPFGCANGACTGNPCQGVTCNMPPANTCLNSTTLRSFATVGTCAGGACSYQPADSTCPFGCAAGACVNDPCQGVTCNMPPARTCLSPTVLRSFSPAGTCSGGGCSYTPSDTTCAFGCAGGACQNDPCQGVTCNMPPATACVGSSLRSYSASGTCGNGTCTYTPTDTPCPGGCANAMCQAPTCGGVSCNTPPASTCLNSNRLRTAFPNGTCNNMTCSYTQYEVLCSQGCINGACIAGSWTVEFMPQASPPQLLTSQTIFDAADEPIQVGCEIDGSFGSTSNGTVRYRRRTTSGWIEETIDVGMGPYCTARVVLDSSGEAMAVWFDSNNTDLRFAKRNGGSWAPKELITTNGGYGSSLATIAGEPVVSYGTATAVEFATRSAAGSWTTETAIATSAGITALRVVAGEPWILANTGPFTLAHKTGGSWALAPFSTATGFDNTPWSFKTDSFSVIGGVARAMITDSRGWMWRQRAANGVLTSEPIGDEPVATRAGPIPATYVHRGTSPVVPMIRVRQNEAWPDTMTTVPYSNQLVRVVSFTGDNGRVVLMDTVGRRLSSPNTCTPLCTGRTCGDDGCGGSCGSCASGVCSSSGTCSPLRSTMFDGMAPSFAMLASGATSMHVLERPTTFGLVHRSLSSGGFTTGVTVPGSYSGVTNNRMAVVNDQPAAFAYNSSSTAFTPLTRSMGGTWSTGPASANTAGSFRYDAAGNAYQVRCTSTQALMATLPVGATAWTPETSIFTFSPSGASSGCSLVEVNATGKVFLVFENKLYSNTAGFTTQTVTGVARMAFDPLGNLHLLSSTGTVVWRAASNTFEVDATAPAGLQLTSVQVAGDQTGQTAVAYLTSTNVTLARRTGVGVWSLETLPLSPATTAPFVTNGSTSLYGLAFDATNAPYVLFNDRGAWRYITK